MQDRRMLMIDRFNQCQVSPLEIPELKSLSDISEGKAVLENWVAGTLEVVHGQYKLLNHHIERSLEDLSGEELVYVDNFKETSFDLRQLRSGDKVAFRTNKSSGNYDFLLLAVNQSESSKSPSDFKVNWQQDKKWLNFVKKIESFFLDRSFYQAITPNLVICPGLEPTLDPFSVKFKFGDKKKTLFLPTSPELHLKKVLSEGVSELFEIKTCYRNEEVSFQHQPEFTMLEWYRSFKTLNHLVEDIKNLIRTLTSDEFSQSLAVEITSVSELFQRYLSFELTPKTSKKDLFSLAQSAEIATSETDSWDDLFFLIFISKIEHQLGKEGLTFVFDYPPSQAALAKINPRGWADRFEMYWQGYEIANAFNELTSPSLQLARFKKEQKEKREGGKEFVPIDDEFIEALKRGLPPTAGIALGVERLFMAIHGIRDIKKLKHFPCVQ